MSTGLVIACKCPGIPPYMQEQLEKSQDKVVRSEEGIRYLDFINLEQKKPKRWTRSWKVDPLSAVDPFALLIRPKAQVVHLQKWL